MSTKFTKLPKTTFSGLEYQNIIEDIIALVKENPEYNEQYDDFLSSNAGRMLIELFAYVTDQLTTRIDFVVNENFLSTATKKSSIIKILKLIGYAFELPISAKVNVKVSPPANAIGKYFSKNYYIHSNQIFEPFFLTAEDRNGDKRTFELLNIDNQNNKINYSHPEVIESKEYTFYEGKTYVEDFFVETDNNQIFTLSNSPVIKDTVQVYRVSNNSEELLQVDSFLSPKSQTSVNQIYAGEIISEEIETYNITYKLNVEDNNTVQVEFPSSGIVNDANRRPSVNDKIRVFYRVGGGSNGNITPKSINVTKKIPVYDEEGNETTGAHSFTFVNHSYGYGGENEESVDNAIMKAPTEIQTAKKTVTEDDYNAVLNSFDDILLSKSIGNSNPIAYSEKLYNKYGKYIDPLEVWSFILKNKEGWEALDPTEYNEFSWFETRLENRFNEEIHFKNGENDVPFLLREQDLIDGEVETFTETSGASKTQITDSTKTFNSSYLGNKVVIVNSESPDNIDLERIIIGGASNNFFLNEELPENTTIGDEYKIYNTHSYNIETPQLFKDNVDDENFFCKITQVKTPVYYFNSIDNNILEINDTLTHNNKIIEEDVYPVFSSKKDIKYDVYLNGSFDLNIDGETPTISFVAGNYSAQDIADAINNSFTFSGSASAEQFSIQGDVVKNNAEIRNITYNLYKLRPGMKVELISGDPTTIKEVHTLEKYIVLNDVPDINEKESILSITDNVDPSSHNVATVEETANGTFLILRSPTKGENAVIGFNDESMLLDIFGIQGYNFIKGKLVARIDENNNIIYNYNSSFLPEAKDVYLQYIVDDKDEITIGASYSQLEPTDPKYKEQADRIYPTVYDTTTKKINYFNSNFDVKFTKSYAFHSSLYAISDYWSVEQNTFPEIESNTINLPISSGVTFNLDIDGNETVIDNVTGFTLEAICLNINNQIQEKNFAQEGNYSTFNYAIPAQGKIMLRSPTNFNSSIIKAEESGGSEFFTGIVESVPEGDFYIIIENDDIKLKKSSTSNLPDFPFYVHFIFDQRYVRDIYDGGTGRKGKPLLSLDEDLIDLELTPYKITGIENVYKQPVFKVFDVVGTITYDKIFSRVSIEREVNTILQREFSLRKAEIGKSIFKSKIISLIHGVNGVKHFNIDYFGLDKNNPETNEKNVIEADFDEIILLGKNYNKGLQIEYKSE